VHSANADDLRARTAGSAAEVAPDKLPDTREGIHYRLNICRAASVSHTGRYL
jgi:hypothetical protein